MSSHIVTFKCPKCKVEGNNYIECVLTGYHHQTVSKIEEDGNVVIYNAIESEGKVDRFQCENCGYVLRDKNGSKIDNEEDLILWLKMNK
jgi:rubredoxin